MKMPQLDGVPSPSLRKMMMMSIAELRIHIEHIQLEHANVIARLGRLQRMTTAHPKIPSATAQGERLLLLISKGKEILDTKMRSGDRKPEHNANPNRRRPLGALRDVPRPTGGLIAQWRAARGNGKN
jgi:hypothetical protein